MSRYRSLLVYNQLLIAHIMSKIIFMKYLTPCPAQIGPKIKSNQNFLKFGTFDVSNKPISILMSKMFFIKYLPIARPQLFPKWKMLRIYWNLTELIFQIYQFQSWCQKWFSLNIYHLLGPNSSKIKSVQNLLKFDTFDISIMLISI